MNKELGIVFPYEVLIAFQAIRFGNFWEFANNDVEISQTFSTLLYFMFKIQLKNVRKY